MTYLEMLLMWWNVSLHMHLRGPVMMTGLTSLTLHMLQVLEMLGDDPALPGGRERTAAAVIARLKAAFTGGEWPLPLAHLSSCFCDDSLVQLDRIILLGCHDGPMNTCAADGAACRFHL